MSLISAQFEKRFPADRTAPGQVVSNSAGAGSTARDTVIRCNWSAAANEFSITVLFGPSGCGKTTILRCLAGLTRPESGEIRSGDDVWFSAGSVHRSPQQRDVGYLFQDYALFPHLTVAENIAYGLRRLSMAEQQRRVAEMLECFQLRGLEHRWPRQISGGQQQRVALARTLARQPRLLLLDEPLSALDEPTREEIRRELRRLLSRFEIPVILVTHDRTEAISLADQVIILDRGIIRQSGPVSDVFSRPSDLTVARIVGVETVMPGQILKITDGLATVRVGGLDLVAVVPATMSDADQEQMQNARSVASVYICIRGEDVLVEPPASGPTSARNRIPATIADLQPEGPLVRLQLTCPGFTLTALVTRPASAELGLQVGSAIVAVIKAQAVHLISHG